MAWEQETKEVEQIAGERRRDRRYSLQLDLRWKLIRRRRLIDAGMGRTIDVSSGGLFLETERPLHPGLNVELSIAWPVMLHNVAPLQLVVTGKVLRISGNRSAIQMSQHEFRTLASHDQRGKLAAPKIESPFLPRNPGFGTGKR